MVGKGRNDGFHVLDDFVCEAIPSPSIPIANPAHQGRNEAMVIVDEMCCDIGSPKTTEKMSETIRIEASLPQSLEEPLKSKVQNLAEDIAATPDPVGTVALVQKLLLAELAYIQKGSK